MRQETTVIPFAQNGLGEKMDGPDDATDLLRQISHGRISAGALARFVGLPLAPAPHPEWTRFMCRRLRHGDIPVRAGDPCQHLYVVIRGSFCTRTIDAAGKARVIAFERASDTLGLDGLASGRYTTESIALELTDVAVIPLAGLARPGYEGAALRTFIYRLLGRQILRNQAMMAMMAASRAVTRLGAFLFDWHARSDASLRFALPMRRTDIASLLGLSKETVSRTCSTLDRTGIVVMRRQRVTVLDREALHRTATGAIPSGATRSPVRRTSSSAPAHGVFAADDLVLLHRD
ncbi:helix-turn-helix domain-containing protein [Azoarcus sp. L1K30]|uniref:Crp/Fnr family transcriptional regulator n=1 Tax=Azoarcus sp. L1K30 TaxID=2820277 RepID=UPI001B81777F|nr:helix-turn-helix domain-containing protein [Azoarcus sp. L1K30]MBR0565661.1 helix-turn-helix domain-containing protein [Azoarcus sp. L1K30]